MEIKQDGKGQPYISWKQSSGFKRAWIQNKAGTDRDWAGTGRYLNVVRTTELDGGPAGNATDFPIYSDLPDEQVLRAFVQSVCAITGCPLPTSNDDEG